MNTKLDFDCDPSERKTKSTQYKRKYGATLKRCFNIPNLSPSKLMKKLRPVNKNKKGINK